MPNASYFLITEDDDEKPKDWVRGFYSLAEGRMIQLDGSHQVSGLHSDSAATAKATLLGIVAELSEVDAAAMLADIIAAGAAAPLNADSSKPGPATRSSRRRARIEANGRKPTRKA